MLSALSQIPNGVDPIARVRETHTGQFKLAWGEPWESHGSPFHLTHDILSRGWPLRHLAQYHP